MQEKFLENQADQKSEDGCVLHGLCSLWANNILAEGLQIRPTIDLEPVITFNDGGIGFRGIVDIPLVGSVSQREHGKIFVPVWY